MHTILPARAQIGLRACRAPATLSVPLAGLHAPGVPAARGLPEGPALKALTVGEHYVATGGWGAAVYWTAFLILGIVIAVGFCALWARMARSLAGRGPLEAILALISGRG